MREIAPCWHPAPLPVPPRSRSHDELALSPKPGLVTLVDSGSHDDMDGHTFMRSLFALRGYFARITRLGEAHAPFEGLERCGIEAEARMLAATHGVNTRRGAIFTLGLLCAAAGAVVRSGRCPDPVALRRTLLQCWGDALAARAMRQSGLPGGIAARRYGLRSASAEAALGFPCIFGSGGSERGGGRLWSCGRR